MPKHVVSACLARLALIHGESLVMIWAPAAARPVSEREHCLQACPFSVIEVSCVLAQILAHRHTAEPLVHGKGKYHAPDLHSVTYLPWKWQKSSVSLRKVLERQRAPETRLCNRKAPRIQ